MRICVFGLEFQVGVIDDPDFENKCHGYDDKPEVEFRKMAVMAWGSRVNTARKAQQLELVDQLDRDQVDDVNEIPPFGIVIQICY